MVIGLNMIELAESDYLGRDILYFPRAFSRESLDCGRQLMKSRKTFAKKPFLGPILSDFTQFKYLCPIEIGV